MANAAGSSYYLLIRIILGAVSVAIYMAIPVIYTKHMKTTHYQVEMTNISTTKIKISEFICHKTAIVDAAPSNGNDGHFGCFNIGVVCVAEYCAHNRNKLCLSRFHLKFQIYYNTKCSRTTIIC